MPHPLSNDLRKRVVRFVEAGHSRNEAAGHFDTSVSFVVKLMKRYRETGRVDPKPRGGFRHGKVGPHRVFILRQVATRGDISMRELAILLRKAKGVEVHCHAVALSDCVRPQLQKKRSRHPNKTDLTLPRREATGRKAVSQSCAGNATG
jgi:transposase